MSQVDLLLAVLTAFGVVYAVLGVLWWITDRADRAAVARVDGTRVDPYHAVATIDGDQGADRAAAELLLAGLIRIEEDGGDGHRRGRGHRPDAGASGAGRRTGHAAR
ncbi:hypothetical protein OHU34_23990 [Streptomyces sp. NBC_00080]|uniref:hypothetical protein n=1 Tax=unclassified Streptomyces TaxID=2593676 RepID=UPI001150A3B7|nr:hypothetical protein [Streptomyces sp. SLBN-115]TQJ53762.1 hypothetical protein FBY34_1504 [Streptomyces sp. SLBN-115]